MSLCHVLHLPEIRAAPVFNLFVGAAAVARRHEIDAGLGVYVCVGAAVQTPAPVAALAVLLRGYSEFSVRYFALQRLLLVCPVLARKSIPAMPPHRETQRMIAMGTISSHSYPPEPL